HPSSADRERIYRAIADALFVSVDEDWDEILLRIEPVGSWPAPVLCTMRYESVLLILAPPPEDNGEWVLVSSGGETPPPHAVYPRHSFFFFSRDAANAAGVW